MQDNPTVYDVIYIPSESNCRQYLQVNIAFSYVQNCWHASVAVVYSVERNSPS